MKRLCTLLCALVFCACKPHPGASLEADKAEEAVMEIHQALNAAQTLRVQGEKLGSVAQWTEAKTTYNSKLQSGVAFHCSDSQALKLSYLLGAVGRELEKPKGQPQAALDQLSRELQEALSYIPSPVGVSEEVAAR